MKLINETFDNDLLEIRVSQNLTKLGAGGGGGGGSGEAHKG